MHKPFMSIQTSLLLCVVGIKLSVPEPEIIEQKHPVDTLHIPNVRHVPGDGPSDLSQRPVQMRLKGR
jgi:hypothetical protein